MEKLIEVLSQQGPLVAFMAIVIFALARYVNSTMEASQKRENERENRYNTLMDNHLSLLTKQSTDVTTALINNTAVIRENSQVMAAVKTKLDK